MGDKFTKVKRGIQTKKGAKRHPFSILDIG